MSRDRLAYGPPCRRVRASAWAVLLLLSLHAAMLAYGAWFHSPTWDEVGHLPAGLSHWKFGGFELYRVNPPLVRLVASLPVLLANPQTDWTRYDDGPGQRHEESIGLRFLRANGERSFWLFTMARWACIPFSLIGACVCYRWASELYGTLPGIAAMALWCFSPSILGHGQLLTPDVGASAMGVVAGYSFWRWLRCPTSRRALLAGALLGMALLTKFTWLVLFLAWPVLWAWWRWGRRRDVSRPALRREFGQLLLVLLLGVYVLNLGYGFDGSLERLGSFRFVSRTLAGPPPEPSDPPQQRWNRFAGTWLGEIPLPLPRDGVLGIDSRNVTSRTKCGPT